MNENEFHPGSVPVLVAARIYGKDASWVRAGIVSGWLPIGKATRNGKLVTTIEEMDSRYGRINFYISPKRLYEESGIEMGTEIRPEISDKSKYWIEKHRYYELKHFCLQYPIWKKAHDALDGLSKRPADLELFVKSGQVVGDPTARCGVARAYYAERMKMVEQAALGADAELYPYILRAVTEGLSYTILKMQVDLPCCKDVYYDRYRRFFWLLSKARD